MKDSGGIHNTTLKIGPPAQFMNAGRYICLVNNPEGHAHKEIFVSVLTDRQYQNHMAGMYYMTFRSATAMQLTLSSSTGTSGRGGDVGKLFLIYLLAHRKKSCFGSNYSPQLSPLDPSSGGVKGMSFSAKSNWHRVTIQLFRSQSSGRYKQLLGSLCIGRMFDCDASWCESLMILVNNAATILDR